MFCIKKVLFILKKHNMLNLIIGLFLVCTSLGVSLSKFSKPSNIRSERKHNQPLIIDKELFR
jgi:hypothetical protein